MVNPYASPRSTDIIIRAELKNPAWYEWLIMTPATAIGWTFTVFSILGLRLLVEYLTMPTY